MQILSPDPNPQLSSRQHIYIILNAQLLGTKTLFHTTKNKKKIEGTPLIFAQNTQHTTAGWFKPRR